MVTDKKTPGTESASVSLAEGMHFVGGIDGFHIDMDAKEEAGGVGAGPDPMLFVLLGLAGCTAMDVISILRKKRQEVSAFAVEVHGKRVDEHPKVYDHVEVIYRVEGKGVEAKALERAIELSETRYCPVMAMVSNTAEIVSRYEIERES